MPRTFEKFWERMRIYLAKETMKQLVLKGNLNGQTILHILASKGQSKSIQYVVNEMRKRFGNEILLELATKTDKTGQNMLHFVAFYGKFAVFKAFWNEIPLIFEIETHKELSFKCNGQKQTILHILASKNQIHLSRCIETSPGAVWIAKSQRTAINKR